VVAPQEVALARPGTDATPDTTRESAVIDHPTAVHITVRETGPIPERVPVLTGALTRSDPLGRVWAAGGGQDGGCCPRYEGEA
jgi:hypothetical protein